MPNSPPAMGDALLPLAVALAAGLVACIATGALIPVLRRRKLLDYPNERSSHSAPTPRGGGIAVVGTVLLAWLILAQTGRVGAGAVTVVFAAGSLAVVCWIDDLRGLSAGLRLLAQ
ncbi:MAG: glycosyl transferase, partial [Alphaproteobacteria bacterium]|nr:glycosyl transferase [Alphaproteobacteria bacterium]